MADKPGDWLVLGDGGRSSSGLTRPRTADAEEGGEDFLELSLGSIYNNTSSSSLASDDSAFSPLDASPAPASGVPAFALGFASSSVTAADGDGDGDGGSDPVLVRASKAPAPTPRSSKAPPRERRGNATGRRCRGGAGDDADADGAPPPFPWAAKTAAGAQPTLAELFERGITTVEGEVRCKRCSTGKTMSYDIRAKFQELSSFIVCNLETMRDRAPPKWEFPELPDCDECGVKNSLCPVIPTDKESINWMFLLLGQTLGLCTLDQLKHFCARTNQHHTGAKDRVLYSTYMELCNQLCPGGQFDMASLRKNRSRPYA